MEKVVVAVPKGRLFEDTVSLFLKAGLLRERLLENSRKLIVSDNGSNLDFILVRARDVITYVVEGISDVGVVGYDLLIEYSPDVFSVLDLGFGYCKLVVAGKVDSPFSSTTLRVATKFPNITKSYFRAKEIEAKVIDLYGSVELGPITGLSDVIVDITSTGATLAENGLTVLEEMFESTSRLIVNKRSFYFKKSRITEIISKLEKVLAQ